MSVQWPLSAGGGLRGRAPQRLVRWKSERLTRVRREEFETCQAAACSVSGVSVRGTQGRAGTIGGVRGAVGDGHEGGIVRSWFESVHCRKVDPEDLAVDGDANLKQVRRPHNLQNGVGRKSSLDSRGD